MARGMVEKWSEPRSQGLVAGGVIVKGLRSKAFGAEAFERDAGGLSVEKVENVKGYLEINSKYPISSWFKLINLATDIHSANVHIFIQQNNLDRREINQTYYLEVIKNIEKGCELLLWFSEEFAAILDMPFLIPKNIIGHKKYRCHVCGQIFENPNPLKIHLFLSCGRESQTILWQSIHKALNRNFPIIPAQSIQLSPCRITYPQLSSDPPSSAFIPYKKAQKIETHHISMQPLNLTVAPSPHPVWTSNILDMKLEETPNNYAADVELFASNWGKLKHGHLCVYCGKVYSRKYGLKIHIRTHTGYKPLKCKYCLRPFGDPSNLNKHVRLHASGLTQYACSLCGKVLVRRRDLERHLRSQHGEVNSTIDIEETSSD